MGETAIYFALNGAKKVIGYEPMPKLAELAVRNIALNGLENKCHIINAGVGSPTTNFNNSTTRQLFSQEPYYPLFWEGYESVKVPVMSLANVVEQWSIENAFLKIDCDGYEYEIICNATSDTLRKFRYILIEFDYGSARLRKKLEEAGFTVKVEKELDSEYAQASGEYKFGKGGYLFAYI